VVETRTGYPIVLTSERGPSIGLGRDCRRTSSVRVRLAVIHSTGITGVTSKASIRLSNYWSVANVVAGRYVHRFRKGNMSVFTQIQVPTPFLKTRADRQERDTNSSPGSCTWNGGEASANLF
jgi:hypothetical protein